MLARRGGLLGVGIGRWVGAGFPWAMADGWGYCLLFIVDGI